MHVTAHIDRCRSLHATPRRRPFTLVELLVVVAIILVLAAMLLPALGKARRQATSTQCMSGQRQIVMALMLYAEEYTDNLPNPWVLPLVGGLAPTAEMQAIHPNVLRDTTSIRYDLVKALSPFRPSLYAQWTCPGVPDAKPINHSGNVRSPAQYLNYEYYAYRNQGTAMVYGNLRQNKSPDRVFMLKDYYLIDSSLGNRLSYNHGSGNTTITLPDNPSMVTRGGFSNGSWANYVFYDGHGERLTRTKVVNLGGYRQNESTLFLLGPR